MPGGHGDVPACAAARQTIADLYRTERDDLYRYLVSSGVEPAQAQDVTQEVFLRLYVALRDGGRGAARRPRPLSAPSIAAIQKR